MSLLRHGPAWLTCLVFACGALPCRADPPSDPLRLVPAQADVVNFVVDGRPLNLEWPFCPPRSGNSTGWRFVSAAIASQAEPWRVGSFCIDRIPTLLFSPPHVV